MSRRLVVKRKERQDKWVKYQHTWAWGVSKWEYKTVPGHYSNKEIREDLENENLWSDKYRRVTFKVVARVPRKVLHGEIRSAELTADHAKARAARLREMEACWFGATEATT